MVDWEVSVQHLLEILADVSESKMKTLKGLKL